MKKVLFFFTAHPRLDMIFKIQSEILMSHILNNDEIYIITDLKKNIIRSQINYNSERANIYFYNCMFENMIRYMRSIGGNIVIEEYLDVDFFEDKKFASISELKAYRYGEYNLGMCVASSSISFFRDHNLDTIKQKKYISRALKNAINVLETIKNYDDLIHPDLVYVFNGRMATYAPIVLYCKEKKINFNVFEFSLSFDKFHLLQNEIPHNIEYRYKEIKELWEDKSISIEEKRNIGIKFFEDQRDGIATVDQSYIGLQNKELDGEILRNKRIITFFNSSIDEFAAIPGWENYVYLFKDEVEAIREICEYYENDHSKQFILRVHPNLKFITNTQNDQLDKLRGLNNLIFVESHSPIRSYSLVDQSDIVITFGSTIGVEACYYGKPVICLGLSFYKNLDVAYIPNSKEELFSLLNALDLPSKPKENTLVYGYWFRSFGEPYANFSKGNITEADYQLTTKQKRIGLIKKLTDLKTYLRILRIFGQNRNILKKIKDPSYKKRLLREFMPWKIK